MHKQTPKHDETKKNIDDSVSALINKIGLENISVSAICKEANISRTNFYYYYKNKEEVILSRFQYMDKFIQDKVIPYLSDNNFEENLKLFATEYFSHAENLNFNYVNQIYISQLSISGEQVTSPSRPIYQTVVSIFKTAKANNEISTDFTPEELANNFLICIRGATFNWCVQRASHSLVESGLSLVNIFIIGIKKIP